MLFTPPVVSDENFQNAWRYAAGKQYRAKKTALVRRITAPLAQFHARQKEPNMLLTCRVFAGCLIGMLFFGYIIYCLNVPGMKQFIVGQATRVPIHILVLTFVTILSYRIINLPLLLLLKLLGICYVPKKFVEDTKNYHIRLSQQTAPTE